MGNMGSGIFVQQAVLAFSCGDMKFIFTYHIIENIGVNTGGVNHNFGFKSFFVFRICVERGNTVTISVFFNCIHLCIQEKFHSVRAGILCKCHCHMEWADNSAGRSEECTGDIIA